jgi:dTDP-4-dehydrorhamnose reductase
MNRKKIVIVGASGRLGAALCRAYRDKFDVTSFDRAQLDLSTPEEIHHKLEMFEFDVLINAAAFTNVDLSETQRAQAFTVNAEAPKRLAEVCGDKEAKLIHFSTDYVFDGEKRKPYTEQDPANPISVYGESKRLGEISVLALNDRHIVIRVSWVFGPERPSFIDAIIKRAQEEEQVEAVTDKFSTPTYTHDIAEMLPHFFASGIEGGILHFANAGECSWQEYAQHALDCCHSLGIPLKAKKVGVSRIVDMKNWVAKRPVYSVLGTTKFSALTGRSPRTWRDAVADYIERSYSKK